MAEFITLLITIYWCGFFFILGTKVPVIVGLLDGNVKTRFPTSIWGFILLDCIIWPFPLFILLHRPSLKHFVNLNEKTRLLFTPIQPVVSRPTQWFETLPQDLVRVKDDTFLCHCANPRWVKGWQAEVGGIVFQCENCNTPVVFQHEDRVHQSQKESHDNPR